MTKQQDETKRQGGFWVEYHGGPRDSEMEEILINPPWPEGMIPVAEGVTHDTKIRGRKIAPGWHAEPEVVGGWTEGVYRMTGWADEELRIARFDWTHDIPDEMRLPVEMTSRGKGAHE